MSLASVFSASTLGIGGKKIRYGMVALGDIAQEAMMPGVAHTGNSEITALVTGDPEKAKALGKRYGVEATYAYEDFGELLKSGKVDAIYISTPNQRHAEFAVPALRAGIHVLLEKPMEISEAKCQEIIDAQAAGEAKLMIAYRLHFEPATLSLINKIRAGELGKIRYFSSSFSQMVDPANHRAHHGVMDGPLYDMGPYPINAARYVFEDEPVEVISARAVRYEDSRLANSSDTVAVTLRFPEDRLAQFVVSYSAAANNSFVVVGTKGSIEMNPCFTYGLPMEQTIRIGEKKSHETFKATDQFGGEMKYFSDCILNNRDPEPNGEEGKADVHVLEAIVMAMQTGSSQPIASFKRSRRIDTESQLEKLGKTNPPPPINAASPSAGN